jgi:hypothetical protein
VDITVSATVAPKNGVMTAGHCFDFDSPPERTRFRIDTTSTGDTPATGRLFVLEERGDYGVLELGNGDRGRTVMFGGGHVVEEIREPIRGEIVCKTGAKTNETCGEIRRTNVSTVTSFGETRPRQLLRGMVRVSYCSEPGDSGSPVFAEIARGGSPWPVAAIGIHSSGLVYSDPDSPGKSVCGEKVKRQNEAFFMPLSGIETEGRFSIRIAGG